MFTITDRPGPYPLVELADEEAESRALVAPARGGMVTRFFAHGRDWLYLDEGTFADPTQNVRGGNPVLFPSPGRLAGDRWERDGRSGSMKQHGFARTTPWREIDRRAGSGASIVLELRDTEATRAQFPWPFRAELRYTLEGSSLQIGILLENPGHRPLPFGWGFHPYFAVPQAEKAQTRIDTRATRAWDNAAKSDVQLGAIDLTRQEVDLHLLDHGSTESALRTPAGTVHLRGSPEFRRGVIWTLAGKDFVCLEPWTCPGNALNTGTDLLVVPAGGERTLSLTISVER